MARTRFKVPTTPSPEDELAEFSFLDLIRSRNVERKARDVELKRYRDRMCKDEERTRGLLMVSSTEADFVRATIKAVESEYRDRLADCWPGALEAERKLEKAEQAVTALHQLARGKMSRRQYEVFFLDMSGQDNKEIAQKLGITSNCVQTYRCEYTARLKKA